MNGLMTRNGSLTWLSMFLLQSTPSAIASVYDLGKDTLLLLYVSYHKESYFVYFQSIIRKVIVIVDLIPSDPATCL